MRKLLISLLLASASATPALAGPDGPRWNAAHPDQGEAQSDGRAERRQARAERSGGAQPQSNSGQTEVRPPAVGRGQAQSDNGRAEVRPFGGAARASFRGGAAGASASGNIGRLRAGNVDEDSAAVTRSTIRQQQADEGMQRRPTNWQMHERRIGDASGGIRRHVSSDDGAEQQAPTSGGRSIQWRRLPKSGSGDLVQPDQPLPRVLRTRIPVISHTPREGTQPPPRTGFARRTASMHWNTDWRHNHRYDWWSWRRTHHSFFHLGLYYDPFGWRYQPYSIGWRLWPAYYSSRYWISDPWYYRLPYAPPGYRWIRYYDDLILVDTWDGQVIDVIYNFFW
jgi:hypothetical protein